MAAGPIRVCVLEGHLRENNRVRSVSVTSCRTPVLWHSPWLIFVDSLSSVSCQLSAHTNYRHHYEWTINVKYMVGRHVPSVRSRRDIHISSFNLGMHAAADAKATLARGINLLESTRWDIDSYLKLVNLLLQVHLEPWYLFNTSFCCRAWCFVCMYRNMGGCSSAASDFKEPEEEFKIPPWQHWRYSRCTVRAHHQLSILSKKQDCDYCRIVDKVRRKTWYRCDVCNLNFCFNRKRNHFRRWHSGHCDYLHMYTWLWNPLYTLKVARNHFWLFCTL